jgi:putative hydrolase of HD superfamily
MADTALTDQIAFLSELDRLKGVLRASPVLGGARRENSAEHSWHVAMCALVLAPHAPAGVSVDRAVRMLLVHDIVEIDAGDAYIYDTAARAGKAQAEQQAADRLFGMLPDDQARRFRALWDEFEARQSPEARFARALDRLQPLLHNYVTEGKSWQEHNAQAADVYEMNRQIADCSPVLWDFALRIIRQSVQKGYLPGELPEDA